ncbi:hypothetical protein BCR33DRAFT_97359 [Rhizoclosmatium globosum]|uniref:Uncharacterized protein n=1 Tax=Rhizoclosmatium globosum TaxID=329046 RepID=A0A1Y2CK99_9FUNG|nr:hypothetical protein BCR33DRAFT_569148 [Rhizoclosmatium globosum]ORY47439.1 hypothetical protein BCR33DRAFT_97359 [Rhizoclosmatium globosum]|eukprot:ORY30093.1 hypothetical protein BCR33DRAFT_569148 [Rhizoclosmatium globosum]
MSMGLDRETLASMLSDRLDIPSSSNSLILADREAIMKAVALQAKMNKASGSTSSVGAPPAPGQGTSSTTLGGCSHCKRSQTPLHASKDCKSYCHLPTCVRPRCKDKRGPSSKK